MIVPASLRIALHDYAPATDTFREEVVAGLRGRPKSIPPKFFYDVRGSQLFDAITELDAYYPTRTEQAIMQTHGDAIADRIGQRALLVEYGSGSSLKTRLLLEHLDDPAGYVPIDISGEHLLQSAQRLAERFPTLTILPVAADYTTDFPLPEPEEPYSHAVAYFPGSTIGNFTPADALAFLHRIARLVGSGGGLLIGVDLQKDAAVLERAYNDPEGVTAAFNLNLLERINRELGGTFDVDAFEHRAVYNADEGRIEMHLVSRTEQSAGLAGGPTFSFEAGEPIVTEYSYKYTLDGFAELAADAGFAVDDVWTDDRAYFSVQYLRAV